MSSARETGSSKFAAKSPESLSDIETLSKTHVLVSLLMQFIDPAVFLRSEMICMFEGWLGLSGSGGKVRITLLSSAKVLVTSFALHSLLQRSSVFVI